jgi:hypothetical protein
MKNNLKDLKYNLERIKNYLTNFTLFSKKISFSSLVSGSLDRIIYFWG